MRIKTHKSYSLISILFLFPFMILAALVDILGLIGSSKPQQKKILKKPKQKQKRYSEPCRIYYKTLEPKKKPLQEYQVEKFQFEIAKAKANIEFLESEKKYYLSLFEEAEEPEEIQTRYRIPGTDKYGYYTKEQIEIAKHIHGINTERNVKAEKKQLQIYKQIHSINMKIASERNKIKQYKVRLDPD